MIPKTELPIQAINNSRGLTFVPRLAATEGDSRNRGGGGSSRETGSKTERGRAGERRGRSKGRERRRVPPYTHTSTRASGRAGRLGDNILGAAEWSIIQGGMWVEIPLHATDFPIIATLFIYITHIENLVWMCFRLVGCGYACVWMWMWV